MSKIIEPKNIRDCTGCELCVYEVQRQLKKIGFEGALIRVFRNKDEETGEIKFAVETDPRIHNMNIEKISEICPNAVFEISEQKDESK